MSDNPFAEPEDDDRTVVVPRASLRAAPPEPTVGGPAGATEPEDFGQLPSLGGSPVLSAAAPLLTLLSSLRNVATVPDPASLRARTVAEVRRYEQALRDAKLPLEQIRVSHYAICASLDDVVQNTPWGSRGPWADASLVSTFHQEVRSGERFFDLLTRLCQTPGKFLPSIELMYLCMSLGMQGRYRISTRGTGELDRVREETYLVILRQRGAAEPALSLHWRGASAPYRPLKAELPLWLTAVAALGLLCLVYVLALLSLNDASDRLFAAGLALPPASMPTIVRDGPPKPLPPPPAEASVVSSEVPRDRMTASLRPDIQSGAVSVVGTPAIPVIRIQSTGMFASGSAVIEAKFLPVLARVATALQARPGSVHVVGYTDDQPIHTVAFPSNYQLSLARARAAAGVIGTGVEAGRVVAEGRADADPIDTNATAQGRQQNRRIEIVAGEGNPVR